MWASTVLKQSSSDETGKNKSTEPNYFSGANVDHIVDFKLLLSWCHDVTETDQKPDVVCREQKLSTENSISTIKLHFVEWVQ